MSTSQIKIDVTLDEKKIPELIRWNATDGEFDEPRTARSMLLSFWDPEEQNTLSIDLWTKELTVEEMNIHFFQVIKKLCGTYLKATNNKEMEELFINFGNNFAKKSGIAKKD